MEHVLIVHYHRRSWAMEQVLTAQASAIGPAAQVLSDTQLPWLAYHAPPPPPAELTALTTGHQCPSIWIIHNHALAKSPGLSALVDHLVRENARLLLQIHDFPEDQRPTAHAASLQWPGCWPSGPRVHYAVLNHRDHRILNHAGVPSTHLHHLPHYVPTPAHSSTPSPRLHAHYATRSLPRKNIPEFIYWAALAPAPWRFTLSGPPPDPALTALVTQLRLPITWGTGLIPHHRRLTTSTQEGFGFSFLESWLHRIPLFGRDLPWLTADYRAHGIEFPSLYPELLFQGIDFPTLTPAAQHHAIRSRQPTDITWPHHCPIPPENSNIIRSIYGWDPYRQRLTACLEKIRHTPDTTYTLRRDRIAAAFTSPS